MINLKEFNLIYFRREDDRKYLGRHVVRYQTILIDSVTGEVKRMTDHYLSKLYRPDKVSNRANNKRFGFMSFGKNRIRNKTE